MKAILWVCVFLGSAQTARAVASYETEFCSTDIETIVEKNFDVYQARISYAHDRQCQRLEILKDHQVLFREDGIDNHYFLGGPLKGRGDLQSLIPLNGRDPHLVISKCTGGAHCCHSLLIFELGDQFKEIAEIESGNYGAEFVDLDGDGIPEIEVADDVLAYQFTDFASSPSGTVILRYADRAYVLAEDLMKKVPPSRRSMSKRFSGWREQIRKNAELLPASFLQALTSLVYTGNVARARSRSRQKQISEVLQRSPRRVSLLLKSRSRLPILSTWLDQAPADAVL